jgi:condensin complex subunit 1
LQVINLVASTCFKILENPSLGHQRTKDTRAGIIQVLGTINKKFNYTLSCGLKFIQHLKHFEHLVQVGVGYK